MTGVLDIPVIDSKGGDPLNPTCIITKTREGI
jgi:hypothetical protein